MAGVFTGVIVSLFIIRFFNKNHSFRTEYDEMQKKVRGEAYMYGFYALIIYEALLAFAETVISIPADPLVLHFSGILLGVGVQAEYTNKPLSHHHDSDWGSQSSRFRHSCH